MISTVDEPAASGSGTPAPPSAPDEVLAAAADQAKSVLLAQVGTAAVGDHLGVVGEDDGVATHYFACLQAGYPGWRWAVTVAHAAGASEVTVDEVVLLPGDESIIAPAWVPYRERIKPGDLSPGDILPTDEDDARLVPAYLAGDDLPDDGDDRAQIDVVADRLGLGRSRVLSIEGRELAADRWYDGERGPESALAQQAHHQCWSCGFLVRLAGPLSETFGVCANEFANDDAHVVAFGHGCGAHSEAQLRKKQLPEPVPDPIIDTMTRSDLETF
ncbi:MAG: hypothetical protein JWO46_3537 [Nocardioidaceae bacterium]|nr:hypothetical protein [Nocardioidaceae bacterium]